MDFAKNMEGSNYNIIQVTLTLATLAYATTEELNVQLRDSSLATEGNWSSVWGPVDKGSNRVYVASKSGTNDYAIAIRGTIRSIESIFIDADSFGLAALPWNSGGGKMISDGMSDAWNHVNDMIDANTGLSLSAFIGSLGAGSTIYVTGHSQGACLASVVAQWLAQTANNVDIIPITFAAESAGNKAFSDLFNHTFGINNLRVFNPHDIVPMGFADLKKIKTLYGSEPPYVKCPEEFKLTIDLLESTIPTYAQTGLVYPLRSFITPVNGTVHWYNRAQVFVKEIEIQHSTFTYQYLTGTPHTQGVPSPWPPDFIES